MSSREFAYWLAYDSIEPIGDRRGDIQAGVVASTISNLIRGAFSRDAEMLGPLDFVPRFETRAEAAPPSPAEVYKKLRTIALLAGAKKVEKG
jgi:hypothetical protein